MTVPCATRLLTGRFLLRPLFPSDAAAMQGVTDHEAITRVVDFLPTPFTLADARALLTGRNGAGREFMGVWARQGWKTDEQQQEDSTLLAVLGAHLHGDDGVEVGYWVAPRHHRQGIAREAMTVLLPFLRECHPARSIMAECRPENRPSWALLLALGFVPAQRKGHRPGRELLLWQEA